MRRTESTRADRGHENQTVGQTADSIVVYRSHGRPVVIREASEIASATRSVPNVRAPLTADSIAKIRAALVKTASISKRGLASVSNGLLVLYAAEAPTPAEYHRRIAKLPVTIKESPIPGGTRRDFYVNRELKLSVFVANTNGSTGEEGATTEPQPGHAAEEADGAFAVTAPSVGAALGSVDYCEYTDEYGYWSGDCAVQADIDDALSTVAALDSDLDGLESEAAAAQSNYCEEQFEPDPDVCGGSHLLGSALAVGGPFDAVTPESNETRCPAQSLDGASVPQFGCAMEAVGAVYAVGGFIVARAAVMSVSARLAAVTMAEVGWAAAGSIVAFGAAAIGLAAYIDCLAG